MRAPRATNDARRPRAPRASRAQAREPGPSESAREERVRRTLLAGAALLVIGLALVGIQEPWMGEVGMVATLAGLLVAIASVHRYGRLGPDVGSGPA